MNNQLLGGERTEQEPYGRRRCALLLTPSFTQRTKRSCLGASLKGQSKHSYQKNTKEVFEELVARGKKNKKKRKTRNDTRSIPPPGLSGRMVVGCKKRKQSIKKAKESYLISRSKPDGGWWPIEKKCAWAR